MKTSEVEKKTGISKQTILYYEKENLLHPLKEENGYRCYTDEDIHQLMLIKFLRSLDITIDDIRLILNGELSFQECLLTQKSFMQESLQKCENINHHIHYFHDKDLPPLPQLQTIIQNEQQPSLIGYRKTTPFVSIGRRPTATFLKKKIMISCLWSLILGGGCSIGLGHITHQNPFIILILSTFFFIIFNLFFIGLGTGRMTFFMNTENISEFIEFHEQGIYYHMRQNFKKQFIYIWNILKNQEPCQYCLYEDIEYVKIIHQTRFMKAPGTNLPTTCQTIDYEFYMKNGDHLYFMNPLVLENDRQILHIILQSKIKRLIEI